LNLKIKRDLLFTKCFSLGVLIILLATILKFLHIYNGFALAIIGIVLIAISVITALLEINSSKKLDATSKLIWTICFLLFSVIIGFVYLRAGRSKIVE
jgi:TctA family transporter